MSEDMSELIQKMNDMIKNDQIPENIKNIISGISSGSSSNETAPDSNTEKSSETTTELPNFDISTILKMKSLMDSINQESNDPRANLLRSLKPYLRSSRKEKVEQYVQLFRMGKVIEIMNPLGGEKKNDV